MRDDRHSCCHVQSRRQTCLFLKIDGFAVRVYFKIDGARPIGQNRRLSRSSHVCRMREAATSKASRSVAPCPVQTQLTCVFIKVAVCANCASFRKVPGGLEHRYSQRHAQSRHTMGLSITICIKQISTFSMTLQTCLNGRIFSVRSRKHRFNPNH